MKKKKDVEQLIRESERIRILTRLQDLLDAHWQEWNANIIISEVKRIIQDDL